MASLKTKFSVGLFLIAGIGVVIIGVIWLGMSHYFEKGRFLTAYFDESVQGLDKDSPVKYRGVYVGRVHSIGVAPDGKLIEVVLLIESEYQSNPNTRDVVAKLKSVGITGLMFIELEQLGEKPPDVAPPFAFAPPFPAIPTRASEIDKLFKGIEDIIELFRALDAGTISAQLTQALRNVNRTIDDAQVDKLAADIRESILKFKAMVEPEPFQHMIAKIDSAADSVDKMAVNADGGIDEIRRTVDGLDNVISASGEDIRAITADLKGTAEQINLAMQAATGMLSNTEHQLNAVQRQLIATLQRLERTTDTMNRFLEHIANQPSQLVFGEPQPEKPGLP
jgi:phospholipid/cholesterol/gamma-HCH transport system substrate-binding protein